MNLDRSLDDILKEKREPSGGGRRRGGHSRGNSFRTAPYQVQRRVSAHTIPTGPRADTESTWKHDLYKTVNKTTNAVGNGNSRTKGEEVIQFPPRKYTEQEKAQMLQTNPLFKRLDNGSTQVPKAPLVPKKDILQFPPPRNQPPRTTTPSGPATSVALTRSESSPQLSSPAITIAGTASSSVILSNLAPTVSVEDIKGTLAGIGGGVREVHIMSRSGKSGEGLQVKVTFNKPAEGGKECIARFNGVVADGRKISAAFETPDKSTSFINRRAEQLSTPTAPSAAPKQPRRNQRQQQTPVVTAPAAAPAASHPMVIDGTQGFVPQLYSDMLLIRAGQAKR